MAILNIFNRSLMITGFVFVMMLIIEYLNVQTQGDWQKKLIKNQWGQYILAAFLGAIPGCLGAFLVIAMFSHRILSIGAVVAAMIATSGDEAFVMLALIPDKAILLTVFLFVIGIAAGALTDLLTKHHVIHMTDCTGLQIHEIENCQCYPRGEILQQWKKHSPFRTTLTLVLFIFFIMIVTGQIGPAKWNWIRISILLVSSIALFIVATVPDHFLEEHLWKHIARQHIPRIFLWTFGTLLVMYVLIDHLHLESIIRDNQWIVLSGASLIGLIPESGPHLMFVTLYAEGLVPFAILLASSIVQDGHGMLPMLAHSKKAFLIVKLINLLIGFLVGAIILGYSLIL
jgi:hypothetical protein